MIPRHQDFLGKEAETKKTEEEMLTQSLGRSIKQEPKPPVGLAQPPTRRGSVQLSSLHASCRYPARAPENFAALGIGDPAPAATGDAIPSFQTLRVTEKFRVDITP